MFYSLNAIRGSVEKKNLKMLQANNKYNQISIGLFKMK